jgi:hypothetical protein
MSILTAGARVGRGDYPAATTNAEAGGQQTSNCCEAEMRENVASSPQVTSLWVQHCCTGKQSRHPDWELTLPRMWSTATRRRPAAFSMSNYV